MNVFLFGFYGFLDDLNLLGNCWELLFEQTIELIETSPCSTFDQTNEDTTHCHKIQSLVTVKNKNLSSKGKSQCLDRLGFTSTSWPIWIPPKPHGHRLRKSKIALISKWRINKFCTIALILKGILKTGISHHNLNRILPRVSKCKLLIPKPIAHLPDVRADQCIQNTDVMNYVQNQRFNLRKNELVFYLMAFLGQGW